MAKLSKNPEATVAQAQESEQKAHKIHAIADELHKKMEKLHMNTIAARKRAHATRERLKAARRSTGKLFPGRKRGEDI